MLYGRAGKGASFRAGSRTWADAGRSNVWITEKILRNGETKVQQKTYYPKAAEIQRDWVVVDAEGQNLGRLATRIAHVLLGKHKPTFTPGVEMGDFVVVVNAEKVTVTGTKTSSKLDIKDLLSAIRYPGGLKSISLRDQLKPRYPDRALRDAVWGMLRTTAWAAPCSSALKIYAGPDHPHGSSKTPSFGIRGK
jgi:large subunit ribosomal protein L13